MAIAVMVAIGAAATGCAGTSGTGSSSTGAGNGPAGSSSPSSTGGTGTTRGTTPDSKAPDLASLITSDVPSPFARQPDDRYDTGPTDLAKAIADDRLPDSRHFYESAGFVAGYQRLWQNPGGDQIIVFVYEFADEDGAAALKDRSTRSTGADVGPSEAFEVASIPDVTGVHRTSDKGYSVWLVDFTKGRYAAHVVVGTYGPSDLEDIATQVARSQFERLPV